MGAKELFRMLEVEANRPRKARHLDAFLPRPEEWPSDLDVEEEKEYRVSDEDVAGLEMEGSVSLQEILDKEIPGGAPSRPAAGAAPDANGEEDAEDLVTAEDMEEMNLGGSVSLDELLGESAPTRSVEDVPTRPAPRPAGGDTLSGVARKDLSLDDILDELVPDDPKAKKKKK
jgi:hypothetical protein